MVVLFLSACLSICHFEEEAVGLDEVGWRGAVWGLSRS